MQTMIYALIIALLTLNNPGPVEVWLFFYNPAGKVTISNEYCTLDSPTVLQCWIPDGVDALELTITAPCHLDRVPVLVSEDWRGARRSVHWEYLPNPKPCGSRLILPLVFSGYDPNTKQPQTAPETPPTEKDRRTPTNNSEMAVSVESNGIPAPSLEDKTNERR